MFAQNTDRDVYVTLHPEYKGDKTFFAYRVYEGKAEKLLNRLLEINKKRRGRDGMHKFSKQKIDGIANLVDVLIYEGVENRKDNRSTGFYSFTSKKYKNSRIARMTKEDVIGCLVYIKLPSKVKFEHAIDNKEDSQYVVDYLLKLLD